LEFKRVDVLRSALNIIFYLLIGIAAWQDLRRRTFSVWIGWAGFLIAFIALFIAGSWARLIILLLTILAFRLRQKSHWADAIFIIALLAAGYREDIWYLLPTLAIYILLCLGWLGACDAEIAFPLIALFSSETLTLYLVGFWVLVPPIVIFWKRGIHGGFHRFIQVARHLILRDVAPVDDADALRLPWCVSPFLALTLYAFVYPAQAILWWTQQFPR
jgi:hypothetical protein